MGALLDRPYGPSSGNPSGLSVIPPNTNGSQPAPLPALQAYNLTTEVAIINPAIPSLNLIVAIPPNTTLEQTPFELNASGYITTGASMTVTAKLYQGTTTSGTLLKSSGAVTQNSATASFWIHAKLIYNSVGGTLEGTVDFYINRGIVASTTLTNFPTGISNTNDPVAQFIISFQFSAANANNVVNVQKFSVG